MSLAASPHHEIHFEDHVVAQLADRGWHVGSADKYDRIRALYPEERGSAGSDLPKCLNLCLKNLILCTDSGLKRPILAIKLDG
jgi:hypothetical protein